MKTLLVTLTCFFLIGIISAQNFEITHELGSTDVSGTTIYYSNISSDTSMSTSFSLMNHSGSTQEISVKRLILSAPDSWVDFLSLEPIPDPNVEAACYSPSELNPWTTLLGCTVYNNEIAKLSVTYSLFQTPGSGTYRYYFMNGEVVLDSIDVVLSTILSTEQLTNQKSVIYPNPTENNIHFSGSLVFTARIVDLNGKLVFDEPTVQNNEISITFIPAGTYEIILETSEGFKTQKLVIRK